MDRVYPAASGQPGDQSHLRQQLSSAYLAGVSHCQDELLLLPPGSLATASIEQARALLKNRAATQRDRILHAFRCGARAARGTGSTCPDDSEAPLNLFIRQPFTESGQAQQALVAGVLKQIEEHQGEPRKLRYLTGRHAESAATFKTSFEIETGEAFTPRTFRAHRLALLDQADAFINIRVGMSESSAFELSYHVFRGACTPVLFLVWKHAPIKTTLLKDLGDLCDVTYLEFEHAGEVGPVLGDFFARCTRLRAGAN
jgi:carbamoyl-phosphate synthase large subunit